MADNLKEELRLIGCHANGDARCTCNIGQDAAARIERLEAALQAADEMADECEDLGGANAARIAAKRAAYRKARGGGT